MKKFKPNTLVYLAERAGLGQGTVMCSVSNSYAQGCECTVWLFHVDRELNWYKVGKRGIWINWTANHLDAVRSRQMVNSKLEDIIRGEMFLLNYS